MMEIFMKSLFFTGLLAATIGVAVAQDKADAPPPPTLSEQEQQEEIEPEVQIIKREDKTIEEYRVNGQLYMIKITPKEGAPYYLVDSDGDGSMDARRSQLEPNLMIPQWVIFRW
jgi:hypothetical protein